MGLLQPGSTTWRTDRAGRIAMLLDSGAYFAAAKAAMKKAKRSIHLLGWAFDPLTRLEPDEHGEGPDSDQVGLFLKALADERPDLDIRVLIWKSALPIAASQHFFPHRARQCFEGSRVKFDLDPTVPFGACHHQKVLVIDDRIAFCGSGDIGADRWDSSAHLDFDLRRLTPWGHKIHQPRHEVMMLTDGPVAAALGTLFRARWRRATDEDLPVPPYGEPNADPWPQRLRPDLVEAPVGIARTLPQWRDQPEVDEAERLHLAAIAEARWLIYLENQYIASPVVAEALAARLAEKDGPEVVIVSTARAPSWFDHMTMDRTRSVFLRRMKAADAFGRFHAYCPYTPKGEIILVHSKVSIIDDRLLRVGSANLNNRSAGFDTECDLATDAESDEHKVGIHRFRSRLIAHFLARSPDAFEEAFVRAGSLAGAIEVLDDGPTRRLRPLKPVPLGPLASVIAAFHLGDPTEPADSWRPWRRRAELKRHLAEFRLDQERAAEHRFDGARRRPRAGAEPVA